MVADGNLVITQSTATKVLDVKVDAIRFGD